MKDTILGKIIQDKYLWIKEKKRIQPLDSFYKYIKNSKRNFYKSLSFGKKTKFILECKKTSPSKGLIRNNFNIEEIAKIYENYASVISVITEEKYFQGKIEYLKIVSKLTNKPILCKDFIIDPWQIYLARFYQADAILLMLSVLDDNTYIKLSNLAHKLNMGVLTEVINEEECKRAIILKAKVIGINNRNLHDLSIDLNRSRILSYKIPKNIIVISESGINCNKQIRKLSKYVNGFLIGSILMSEHNLKMAIHRILFGENKICGLTRKSDLKMASKVGALYGGLIFISNSLRYLKKEIAAEIINGSDLFHVGVFRNSKINDVIEITNNLSLSAIQLHGNEDQNYINLIKKYLPKNCSIWKAININQYKLTKNLIHIDRFIIDNKQGGSGEPFDWSLLNNKNLNNVILAGGLSEKNIKNAIKIGCIGLDFNSGIEISPGIKDYKKMLKVFNIIRDY